MNQNPKRIATVILGILVCTSAFAPNRGQRHELRMDACAQNVGSESPQTNRLSKSVLDQPFNSDTSIRPLLPEAFVSEVKNLRQFIALVPDSLLTGGDLWTYRKAFRSRGDEQDIRAHALGIKMPEFTKLGKYLDLLVTHGNPRALEIQLNNHVSHFSGDFRFAVEEEIHVLEHLEIIFAFFPVYHGGLRDKTQKPRPGTPTRERAKYVLSRLIALLEKADEWSRPPTEARTHPTWDLYLGVLDSYCSYPKIAPINSWVSGLYESTDPDKEYLFLDGHGYGAFGVFVPRLLKRNFVEKTKPRDRPNPAFVDRYFDERVSRWSRYGVYDRAAWLANIAHHYFLWTGDTERAEKFGALFIEIRKKLVGAEKAIAAKAWEDIKPY